MENNLRILILEDIPSEVELIEIELRKANITFTSKSTDAKDAFLKELEEFVPDIVLADYMLPQFTGMEALKLVQELSPLTPFIITTGSMNEEIAVECMKAGAWDYVMKEHLGQLGLAIQSALEKKNSNARKRNSLRK